MQSVAGLLSLNDDVLHIILSYASPYDAMQLATTNSRANAIAMPRILSDVIIGGDQCPKGDGPRRVTAFCKFICADVSGRAVYLRSLELAHRAFIDRQHNEFDITYDLSCVPLLAQTLHHASCITKISITEHQHDLASQLELVEAFASLQRLDSIELSVMGKSSEASLGLLSRMICRPRYLTITDHAGWNGQSFINTALPQHLADRVEQLRLVGCVCLAENPENSMIWSSVQALVMTGPTSQMSVLARVFPNLRSISIGHMADADVAGPADWPLLDQATLSLPFSNSGICVQLYLPSKLKSHQPAWRHSQRHSRAALGS